MNQPVEADEPLASEVRIDAGRAPGYARRGELQRRFEAAAAELREKDGWPDPVRGGRRRLVADLALDGGGVKGVGLLGAVLVLDEAGYAIRAVAGTSAGAIAATLIAAIVRAGVPMTRLCTYLGSLDFAAFVTPGPVHRFLDHAGGDVGSLAADAAVLSHRTGLYDGNYLDRWLRPILEELGVTTFGDLRLTKAEDPGVSLADGHGYRLLVHTADVTRAELARLPWDYPRYGHDPDGQDLVAATRASMSIPFFFEPVEFRALPATVTVPRPDGGRIVQRYEGGTVTWVDGGLLRKFPISAFDRVDGRPPRWPTIGIKLSSLQTEFPETHAAESSLALGVRCLRTLINEWDAYAVDETTAGRTIFVANAGVTATQFDLTAGQRDRLFLNGVVAATRFVLEMAEAGGVPRTAAASLDLMAGRRRPSG